MVDTRAAPDLPPGLDCLPPTADDLPYADGEPLESNLHAINLRLLVNTLGPYLAARRQAFIGDSMFVYFSPEQEKRHHFRGSDFFVVLDVPPGPRKSWVVWQEDGRVPDVVIELTSDSTSAIDRRDKLVIYQDRLRVPEYFLFHPWTAEFAGYRLEGWQYQPIQEEPDGGRISRKLDLKLVVWDGVVEGVQSRWLRWATLDGAVLPTGAEDAAEQRQRAEAERQRADALQAELERLRAQLGGTSPGA